MSCNVMIDVSVTEHVYVHVNVIVNAHAHVNVCRYVDM